MLEAFLAWLNKLDAVRDRTFVIPISTVSDVNQPLRMALRFCGFAPTSKSAEQELLTLVRPERLAAPEWMHVEGALE